MVLTRRLQLQLQQIVKWGLQRKKKKGINCCVLIWSFWSDLSTFFLWWQSVEVLLITGTFQSLMILFPDSVIGPVIMRHMHIEVCSSGVPSMHIITGEPLCFWCKHKHIEVCLSGVPNMHTIAGEPLCFWCNITCLITCWNAFIFSLIFFKYYFLSFPWDFLLLEE